MKTSRRSLLLAAVLLCGPALAQSVVYVDDDNCPGPGTGTPGDPFCTIAGAIDAAAGGDTVQVLPGTYNECVNTGAKRLAIVADNTNPSLDATDFIIDGGGICAPVTLGGDSGLDGFTVRNGGDSGIRAFGSVSITNNIIIDNISPEYGGGLYLYADAGGGYYFAYGDVNITVEDNTIDGNEATIEGGGAYLWGTGSQNSRSVISFQDNTVTGNFVTGNPSFESVVGGGISALTNTGTLARSEIVISRNVINDNSAAYSEASFAYGGGVSVYTFGYGSELITIEDNTVSGNSIDGSGGGISAWILGDNAVDRDRSIVISGNTVSGNSATDSGGGLELFINAQGLPVGREIQLAVPGNTVRSNTAGSSGGGALVTFFADYDDSTTRATVELNNNLMAENSTGGPGGAIDLLIRLFSDTEGTIDLGFNTIAGNTAATGAGGVSISSDTTETGTAVIRIENSIIAGNDGFGIALLSDEGDGVLELDGIEYNLVHGNSPDDYDTAVDALADIANSTNFTADPLLDTDWIPDVCSPAIDGADPTADFSSEPEPNGDRANLGYLGGSSDAVTILPDTNGDGSIDGLDILELAVAFASGLGDPRYSVSADIDLNGMVEGPDLSQIGARFGTVCP